MSTPELFSPQVPAAKKRRSTFDKAPTPELNSPVVKSPGRRQSGRKNDGRKSQSPSVKTVLDKMDSNMTDQEMKDSLMSAIDEKVKEKGKFSKCLIIK